MCQISISLIFLYHSLAFSSLLVLSTSFSSSWKSLNISNLGTEISFSLTQGRLRKRQKEIISFTQELPIKIMSTRSDSVVFWKPFPNCSLPALDFLPSLVQKQANTLSQICSLLFKPRKKQFTLVLVALYLFLESNPIS